MDFGCLVDGYCSDMTRTVAVGEVTDEQRMIYDTVLRAQLAAIAAVKPGEICHVVDAAARDIITDAATAPASAIRPATRSGWKSMRTRASARGTRRCASRAWS